MFTIQNADGASFIGVNDVEDREAERLKIVVEDGRVYLFQLVTLEVRGTYLVLDEERSDQAGIEHAHAAFLRVRSQPHDLRAIYFREWSPERSYETQQPEIGEWLKPLVGYLSPAKPWSVEGVRHPMLGGPITEITSTTLQMQH